MLIKQKVFGNWLNESHWGLSTGLRRSLMYIISYTCIRQSNIPQQRDKVQNKMFFKIKQITNEEIKLRNKRFNKHLSVL